MIRKCVSRLVVPMTKGNFFDNHILAQALALRTAILYQSIFAEALMSTDILQII